MDTDDIRKLSRDLDAKVQRKEISWKTATNVWGTATRMCADAAESKIDALRVREDDPAQGVRGPDRVARKAKQFLYPDEALAFITSSTTPLVWRRVRVRGGFVDEEYRGGGSYRFPMGVVQWRR